MTTKPDMLAAMDSVLGAGPAAAPAGGGGTVECKVCGYIIDSQTGEVVAEPSAAPAAGPAPAPLTPPV